MPRSKRRLLISSIKEKPGKLLITGDNDLLDLKVYGRTKIVTVKEFKEMIR